MDEQRSPEEVRASISWHTIAYYALGALAAMLSAVVWQVWINTNRLATLEAEIKSHVNKEDFSQAKSRIDAHENLDLERSAAIAQRLSSIEIRTIENAKRQDEGDLRLSTRMDGISSRVDAVAAFCEDLKRQRAK